MNIELEVRPGANRYVSGEHILTELPLYLESFNNIAVITGDISFKVFKTYYTADFPYPIHTYDGTASEEDAERLAEEIGKTDVILTIGGGRVLDTGKMTAEKLGCELILIPTLISNCAPYTPIAAVYHPDHSFREIQYFTRNAFLSLIDWNFLLATPRDYLIAGIGDTVAKWFEIEGITRNLSKDEKKSFIRLGIACAAEIRNILLDDSEQALKDLDTQTLTPAFGRIADTVIALAGTVGGFAANYGRSAGAHAIHNGLSYLPETHALLHGVKVAYGVLVQLSYTGDLHEVEKLLPFYESVQLPTSLSEMNIPDFDKSRLATVAELAASPEDYFVLIDSEITSEKVLEAIEKLEWFVKQLAADEPREAVVS